MGSRVQHAVSREEDAQGWGCRVGNVATCIRIDGCGGQRRRRAWVHDGEGVAEGVGHHGCQHENIRAYLGGQYESSDVPLFVGDSAL